MREEISIRENGSKRVKMFTTDPGRTRQEFRDECDLDKVIKRFSRSPEGRQQLAMAQEFVSGRFEDVSGVVDYRTGLEQIQRADEAFNRLPAELRKRFQNDTAAFLDFVDDPKNLDEMRKLGLAKPEQSEYTRRALENAKEPVRAADAASSTPPVKG